MKYVILRDGLVGFAKVHLCDLEKAAEQAAREMKEVYRQIQLEFPRPDIAYEDWLIASQLPIEKLELNGRFIACFELFEAGLRSPEEGKRE